jgi:hypothetical protein
MGKFSTNKRSLIGLLLILSVAFLLCKCKKYGGPGLSKPHQKDAPPAKVSNVKVQGLPGGARISYTLPKSKDLGYVKAVYSTKSGGQQSIKASKYRNSLEIEGFANMDAHKVILYSVSAGKSLSQPVNVTIYPLPPPFISVYNSIIVNNAPGGLSLKYGNNNSNAKLTFVLLQDSAGELSALRREYISKQEGSFNIHGLLAKKYKLGYYIRDKYQNYSDTTFTTFTPHLEVELNRHLFSNAALPTDSWEPRHGNFSNIWAQEAPASKGSNWVSETVDKMPIWITIDLGQKAKVTRVTLYGIPHWAQFTNSFPKKFALWGSTEPEIADSAHWQKSNSWFKYGEFITKPPSPNYDIDTPYPKNAINLKIKNPYKFSYSRYLRIEVFSTYAGINGMAIGSLDIYGAPKDLDKNK